VPAHPELIPPSLISILNCIGHYGFVFTGYRKGFKRYGGRCKKLINSACRLAEKSDIVLLFIGLDELTESEGLDRSSLKIPENQIILLNSLAATGKKIVVVLSCGCAVEMDGRIVLMVFYIHI
jgi:beta-glucosidase